MSYKNLLNPALIVSLVVMAVAAFGMGSAINALGLHLKKQAIYAAGGRTLQSLPIETANWKREGLSDANISEEVQKVLGTDNFLSRRFIQKNPPDGRPPIVMEIQSAYYTNQIDTVPHVPDRCFIGGGWSKETSARTVKLPLDQRDWLVDKDVPEHLQGKIYTTRLPNDHPDFPGVRVRLPREPDKIKIRVTSFTTNESREARSVFSGYFFVANGGWVANAEGVRTLSFDLTADYAYYMKIQFTSMSVGSAEELAQAAASLLDDLFGDLMLCTPDWVEVELGEYPADNPRRSHVDD